MIMCCVNNIHGKVNMEKRNIRVRTHNLGSPGKRMNGIVQDVEVY